jgi:hypothetical protein
MRLETQAEIELRSEDNARHGYWTEVAACEADDPYQEAYAERAPDDTRTYDEFKADLMLAIRAEEEEQDRVLYEAEALMERIHEDRLWHDDTH